MAQMGNPNSISDIGVAVLSARSSILGAFLNVKINARDYPESEWIHALLEEAAIISKQAQIQEKEILAIVENILAKP